MHRTKPLLLLVFIEMVERLEFTEGQLAFDP